MARAQGADHSARRGRPARKNPRRSARGVGRPWNAVLQAAALGLLAFLLYAGTLGYGYVLDDDIATRRNALVQRGAAGIPDLFRHGYFYGYNGREYFYRPAALASLALETGSFGESARVHHAGNVLLFALGVALLSLFLSRALGPRRSGHPAAGPAPWLAPLAAALLFAVHPIHTEVVANIKSRDELLSFACGIGALWLLLVHADSGRARAWGASVACYLFAALSKETGLAFIGLVPLTLWFFRRAPVPRLLLVTAPYAAAAALFLVLRSTFAGASLTESDANRVINNVLVTAPDAGVWLASRVAVLGRYLWLLVVPYPLSYDYSYAQVPLVGLADVGFLASLVTHLGLAVVAIHGLARRTVMSYAIAFYALMLALVSNLVVPLGAVMGERLVFASSAGFCLAAGWGLARLADRPALARPAVVALAAIAVLFGGMSVARARDWRDPGTLLASGLRSAPRSARVQDHYGSYLRDQALALPTGNPRRGPLLREALTYYSRALEILPDYPEANYNSALVLYQLGDSLAALRRFEHALLGDSTWADALTNVGVLHFRAGAIDSARSAWLRVIRLLPDKGDAYQKMGIAYFEEGRRRTVANDAAGARRSFLQSAAWLEQAFRVEPGFTGSMEPLVSAYRALGDSARARKWQERVQGAGGVTGAR